MTERPCDYCGGYGAIYEHTADCHNDFCALAGGYGDCDGIIVPCACSDGPARDGNPKGGNGAAGAVHDSPDPKGRA